MANTLKFGNGQWASKEGSVLAYNDENNNFKPLPFDFTRASGATRVNKDGLIEVVGSNEPRIDFQGNTKGALLLEPSRTNKVSTSNDFNGSGWLAASLIASANQVISPDGTLNASKLEMIGDGSLRNQSEASFNDGYAYSIFVKKGNSSYVTIRSAFFTQSFNCGFDLDTLTAEANGKIEDYGNDWYRLSITKNISGDADRSGFFYLYLPNSFGSQTSVSGNYAYFYGGQIEDGSYATSYIPTSAGAVTRVGDVCNNAGNEQVINSTEGVLYFEGSALVDETIQRWISLGSGSNANRVSILFNATSRISCSVRASSSALYDANFNIGSQTNYTKAAIRYKNNDFAFFVNGVKANSQLSGTLSFNSPLSELAFDSADSGSPFYGKTSQIQVFTTALTDQELIALTS